MISSHIYPRRLLILQKRPPKLLFEWSSSSNKSNPLLLGFIQSLMDFESFLRKGLTSLKSSNKIYDFFQVATDSYTVHILDVAAGTTIAMVTSAALDAITNCSVSFIPTLNENACDVLVQVYRDLFIQHQNEYCPMSEDGVRHKSVLFEKIDQFFRNDKNVRPGTTTV
ncbi:hypothetical protein ACOME3_001435 [Neoechinorhynchus agilis]